MHCEEKDRQKQKYIAYFQHKTITSNILKYLFSYCFLYAHFMEKQHTIHTAFKLLLT